jgi:hypothetical protein
LDTSCALAVGLTSTSDFVGFVAHPLCAVLSPFSGGHSGNFGA